MSYKMEIIESYFVVRPVRQVPAVEAIKAAFPNERPIQESMYLDNLMSCFGVLTRSMHDHGHFDIYFDSIVSDQVEELWDVLALYVEEDSYIRILGEDGMVWKYVFHDKKKDVVSEGLLFNDDGEPFVLLSAQNGKLNIEFEQSMTYDDLYIKMKNRAINFAGEGNEANVHINQMEAWSKDVNNVTKWWNIKKM